MKAELLCIIERFPGVSKKIQETFESDRKFQALCHDYLRCLRSLDQWVRSRQNAETFIRKYAELKEVFEGQLLTTIEKETVSMATFKSLE